jgi:WD40 repeat protein
LETLTPQFRFAGHPTQIGGRNENEALVDTKIDDPKTMLLDGSLNPIAKLADKDDMSQAGFSPDGAVAWVLDDVVALWDAATGRAIGRCTGYAGAIGSVAFSPDGRLLATLEDRAARLWSSRDGTLLVTYPVTTSRDAACDSLLMASRSPT